ncbi:MAG: P-II family nitrogen regulator [Dehalococcoidia bacterium]
MREIKALIRPNRFDAVLDALHEHPELPGVTLSEVRGFGRTVGRSEKPEEVSVQFGTAEMVKLECVVNDDDVDTVIDLIQQAAHTGIVGDGKIFVYDVERAVKIRTGASLQRLD